MALPEAVLGPLAKRAMRVDCGGKKRLKLLVLLAAYADAGEPSPPARVLAERLGIQVPDLDRLLKALQRDGHLKVAWRAGERGKSGARKNVYTLHLDEAERVMVP
jgi:DNA-binding MarR family transcriptional regulator